MMRRTEARPGRPKMRSKGREGTRGNDKCR